MNNTIKGSLIAVAAAGLFACASSSPAPAPSGMATAKVKCFGINSCRSQAECATKDHPCGKHTPCAGQGWVTTDTATCQAKGGTILES